MKKDNLEAIYPLSPMQEGMLFHNLYAPQVEVYFEQFAYTLHGDLDVPAFKAAWQQVVAQHPVLRTLFLWEQLEKPLQVVRKQVELPWREQDWRSVTASEQDEQVQTWLQADRAQGFDLSQAPLMRLNLIRLGERVYHFTWSYHHLLLDGWSVFTVMDQVFSCYEAVRRGKAFRLPSSRPFRDYITWLRQQDLSQAESFWRESLRGFTAPTPLGIDRASHRTSELPGDYRNEQVRLSEAITAALQRLARQHQITLNTLVQGAWALLLSRYSGQEDVVFGTTVSGRPAALTGVESMVGLFINTLPLCVRVDPWRELLPWLQELQAQQVETRQYEYSPLMQVQAWSQVPRGQPLFENLLIFASYPADTSFVQESSLEIEHVQVVERTNYPLTVSVTPLASMLVRVSYAGTHFAHESIRRMLGHLQTLLESMVADPRQRLSNLPLLTEAECQQQLFDWNATRLAYPQETCLSLFEKQVERVPEAIALVFGEQQLTYGELSARANQLAHCLQRLGVGPEVCVGLCLERSTEMIVGLLGILKAGGAYVPLDPAYPSARSALMMRETQAPVLLTQQSLLSYLPSHEEAVDVAASLSARVKRVICLDRDWPTLAREDTCNPRSAVTTANLAYVIYTSGSTGRPKGTLVEHRGLTNLAAAQVRAFAIGPSSRVLQYASLSFDAAVSELFTTLLTGAILVLEPKEALYPGPGLLREMREQAIDVVTLPPSVLSALPSAQLPVLHTLVAAGETCSAALVARWARGRRFLNAYGPTEASVCATIALCDDGSSTPPIGRPIDNVQVYVLDEQLRPAPIGITGELYIASVGLARGYLDRPELTAERFLPDPFSREPGARLYRTGDLVRYRPNGEIEFVGRQDGQVKVRGYRIEVGEIEAVLSSHPSVRDVVVLAREEETLDEQPDGPDQAPGDKRLVAYLVVQTGSTPTTSEVRAYLLQHLPEYMVPAVYTWLDALPYLPNGKVDRRALPAPEGTRPTLEKAYAAPRTPLEQYLAGVWQELLKLEAVGIHDNFFELGGDSIKAVIAINKVQERLGIRIYAVALFDAPTIAQLANYLAEQYTGEISRLFGQESLPSSISSTSPTRRSYEPVIDAEKVRLLRQMIAPLSPYPSRLEPITIKNPPAVFVLSPPRSGSTLLRVMLAGHPQLFAPPELHLLSFQTLGERFAAFSGRNAFWLEGLIRALMELKDCDARTAQRLMANYEAQDLPTQQFYRLLQEWLGERLLVDKTPAYALDLAILRRADLGFHEARYIHLVRHPRAVIHSFEAARLDQLFFRHSHSFSRRELAELIWVVCQQNIQEFLLAVPAEQQYQVSYEELVQAPQQVMEGLCGFLGLEYHPAMIDPYQGRRMTDGITPLSKMIGDIKFHEHKGIDATAAERWKERQDEAELGEITWEIAASLGYERTGGKPIGEVSTKRLPLITTRRADKGEALPLSYVQERLWFLDQWEPQSAAYNMFSGLRLQGALDVNALQRSLHALVQRHDSLRTTFLAINGQPVQVITPWLPTPLPVVDLGGLSPKEQEAQLQHLAQQEAQLPFDLSRGPLLRATLLRVHQHEHVFLLTQHHIISDGWSLGVFNRELVALYEAFSQEQPSPLPPLPIQYADFALWQRQLLQGEVLEELVRYWKNQLQGAPALLNLPTDRPRPPVQTFVGSTHQVEVSAELTHALRTLAQRESVTLFTVLLATLQTLLMRYSQQENFCIGTYIAGRTHIEIEQLVGYFINNLALRTDLSGDPSFREALRRASQVMQGAYAHQELPFEVLLQELQVERTPRHTPLFQVMLIYQNMPWHSLTLPGLTISPLEKESARANFDLSLWVIEGPQELYLTFAYNTDLFDATTIRRLAGHFQRLLQAAVEDPDQSVWEMPLLSAGEQQQMLASGPARVDDAKPLPGDFASLFVAQAVKTPDAIAVVYEDQHLTYGDLLWRVERLAAYLQEHGVGPEVAVGLYLEHSLEAILGLLSILQAGGIYVPLDPGWPGERLAFILRDTQMSLLLTRQSLLAHLPQMPVACTCLDTDWPAIIATRELPQRNTPWLEQLAYVIYTSGSTGQPKGVGITHRSLDHFTSAAGRLLGIEPGDRVLQFASLSFDASLEEIAPCLSGGGTLCVRSESMLSDPHRFLQTCTMWGVSVLDLPTAYWHELALNLDREETALPASLRLVIIGGEKAQAQALAMWRRHTDEHVRLVNTYGPTEATVVASAHWVERRGAERAREEAVIGRALPHAQTYVLDRHLQPVPIGVPGELYIGGAGVARGYLHRPDLTAERFVPHPFSQQPGARLYRTGDLVRCLANGELEFWGRVDSQVKIRGYRIEPGEIEAVLARHPLVRETVVLAREDTPGDKRLVAYVVTGQEIQELRDRAAIAAELRAYLQQSLPAYLLPGAFVLLDAFPRGTSGKVNRRVLPVPEQRGEELTGSWEAPRTPTEELLANLWTQVLRIEQVGRHDHFFHLGGHSLLATQLVARLRQVLGVEVSLRAIFDLPTLAGLAREIDTTRLSQQPLPMPALLPHTHRGEAPLSYAQQRLWFLDQLQPESSAYNIALTLELSGQLNIATLEYCFQELVRRHEGLRTAIVTRDGRSMQLIASSGQIPLLLLDISPLNGEAREQELDRLAQQEAQRPFDLTQGSLMRTTLIRLEEERHVLLLTMHHIITDAWSMGVLLRELAALYRARVQGAIANLPALSIQYADYALWQRQWLEGRQEDNGQAGSEGTSPLEQQLAYWQQQLAGAPALLELPTDHPRPQVQTFRGAHYVFPISPPLLAGLRQLSRQEGTTSFMTLLAAFAAVLARYSGQEDMVVGTPIANRMRAEVEGVLGFFVNTLALRLDLSGNLSVRELLKQVREVALEAYAHQDLPFERLVDALHPQRDLSYTPLFQVIFALQNVTTAVLDLPELTVVSLPVESGIARFDLTLTMQESQQEMLGVLEYNLDLFEPATIERLAGHFQTLLQAMVARPAQRLADLPLLTGAERQQLLVEWNATQSSYPQDQCLSALFEKQVEYAPEAIALVCGEHQLTYGELNARATHLAWHLHQLGVRSETLVGVALERSLELVIGLLAIIKAGGAYVPLDLSYPAERLAFMLADAHITLLLTQEHLQSRFSTHKSLRLLCLDRDWPIIAQQLPERPLKETSADSLGYVIYTSGSTGQPKGVAVQQRSIVRLVCGTDYVPLNARQTLLQLAPISFDAATFELWGALLQGGRCVLVRADMPGVQQLGELLKQEAISILWLTASLFNVVVDEAPEILTGLRHLLVGGEALSVSHVRRGLEALPGVRLINGYGPTENTTFSCCYPIERPLPASVRSIPIGRPIANTQAYVLDRRGEPVPVGVTGELYLGGAGLARGYLGRPDLTAERFVPHPFSSESGARLYRTGDRVRSRVDGTLEFLGRDDQQVKLRGFRIELEEIEAVLLQHPAIQEAVALLHEESPGEKRLVAYVVPQQQIPVVISDLRHYVQARLPDYMVPAAFVLLEALPLTPNGKLDRRALPTPQRSRPAQDNVEMAPRTPEEELLVAIWTQLLGIEQVGIHDNFFELGGDSILSIQVVARATAAGLPLTPRHLFQHQTIARLAAVFGLAATAPAAQAEQKAVSGPLLLTPIHHWFFQQSLPEPQHWNQARIVQLRQPLTPAVLEQALHILLVHHDALRLRVRSNPEGWQLFHALSDERVPLMCIDLADLPQAQQRTALEAAATALQASLDLNQGPIVCAALFDLGSSQPARLLLVIHHLAVDIVSWPILLEDIQTACQQLSQGQPVRLPPKTTSYQHWAERLSEYAQSPAVQAQLDYWLAQPWQAVRPLPLDMPAGRAANSEASARTVVMALSVEETQALLSEVPRAYHTHINEVLLTALVQAFARWTGTPSLLLHLEGHGREDLLEGVDLSRTVGWFTSLVPLVLTLADKPGAGEPLKSIKEQVRHVPQGGVGFGLLRYLSQEVAIREQLAALPLPQVSFNYGGRTAFVLSREEGLFAPAVESAGAMHSLRGQRPHILDINCGIVDGRLFVEWTYSESLHLSAAIERLAHFYQDSLQSLIRHCQSPEAGGYTPSDFSDAELSQGALDTLVAHLANTATRGEHGLLRVDLEAIYPLSPMQEGILFHSLYAPQSEVYFEQFTYTLRGNLDVPAFKTAWQRVVARHPILRTLFLWENLEKPLQVVRKQVELSWSEYDWCHLRSEEQDERLQAWLQADRAQGFDLGRAPLLRLGLIRLGERTYRFTWSFHHLLLDGWSVFTVLGEVFAYHEATCQGRTLTLPPGRPYCDYIAWLRQQNLFPAETFWRETLRGFTTPTLDMGRATHREVEPTENYHHYVFRISEDTTAGLQTLARQQQLTLNTLVQGAWALLLARYSGQQDVVFGATVSGRPAALAGVESMVGLFINTLPLRVQMAPRQQLLPWLQALQARQAEARQYEYSPLAQIQGWSEVPRGQPLFDSLLVFENYPVDASAMRESSLEIEIAQVVERTNYPLTVTVLPGARLSIRLSYMGGRFDAPTIERLSQHFQMLLEDMVTHPEQQLIDLPLLTRAEQAQLRDWNATELEYPRDVCLQELFEAQVERTPEAVALICEEQQLTYGELNARANRLAHFLQRLGVGPEVLVGLYLDRSLDMMVGLLGVLKAGGAYVPLDPGYPAERLSFLLQDARIPLLLTQQQHMARLPEHRARVVSLDSDWSTIERESAKHATSGVQPEHLAYVIYTSGSTGQPKGVLGIHQATINRLHWMWERFPFEAEEVCCQKTSISFVDSIWEMLGPLLQGIPTVIIPDEIVKDPHRLAHTLAERRVTRVVTVPSLLQAVLDTGLDLQALLSRVKYWVSSGEALSVDLAAHFLSKMPQSALINLYGSSEVAADATCYLVESCQALINVPIGHPIANTQVYLLDAHMQPVPIGAVGELCIGGANLSRGYLYRPDMTAEKFLPHPFSHEPGARLYRTGDLARYLPDGNLEILGRIDSQVKVRGYRIELGEIEAALARHPAVGAAVVVMREDEPGDKRLIAYVVPREAEVGQVVLARETEPADLRTFLRGKLPEYMLPSAVVRLSALPLLPNGKVDRRVLSSPDGPLLPIAEQEETSRLLHESEQPRTPVEVELAHIWSQVLRLERVGIHEHFFQLGGHSLLATRVVSHARAAFHIDLPLQSLFVAPTIADMARAIEQQQNEQGERHVAGIQRGERDDAERLLEQLDQLSPEEMEALFNTMVTEEEIDG